MEGKEGNNVKVTKRKKETNQEMIERVVVRACYFCCCTGCRRLGFSECTRPQFYHAFG